MSTNSTGSQQSELVSVIIPTKDHLEILKACIGSLMVQTHDKIEVIVIDNGSSDGTTQYLQANHPSVAVITNSHNLGFGKAVNQGIKAAKGRFVFILNNDTELDRDCIRSLARARKNLRRKP